MKFEIGYCSYNSVGSKYVQLAPLKTKLAAKNFFIVLPQKRCRRRRRPLAVHHKRTARLLERTENRVADRAEKTPRLNVRVVHEIQRRVDGQPWNAVFLHQLREILLEIS